METPTSVDVDAGPVDLLGMMERLIRVGAESSDFGEARRYLRQWLIERSGAPSNSTIGEAIAFLANDAPRDHAAASVLLRCLPVQGLLPPANNQNQINRNLVALTETALPELCQFLGIEAKQQTYEKHERLFYAHQKILEIISPLSEEYPTLESLIQSQKPVLGSLNHSIAKKYLSIFSIKEVRSFSESLYAGVRSVLELRTSLLDDVDECLRRIADGKQLCLEIDNFLTEEFLSPFLGTAETSLHRFVDSVRGRFHTEIVFGQDQELLQKRYPLHEASREILISVPLINKGPGLAADVRASVTAYSDDVVFDSDAVFLGNVAPGSFSIQLQAMVIEPTERLWALMQVEWRELGRNEKESTVFDFEVIAQRSDIDWSTLEYWHPYSTDVAEGKDFIGRVEQVNALAGKLLRHPMEPFYITGQKRVGKTSLGKAVRDAAVEMSGDEELCSTYILWGEIAHEDARSSLRALGESIELFISRCLPHDASFSGGEYQGTLAPVLKVADLASRVAPGQRFIIIVDEFDEIHQELYLYGNLAETFFANIRAITTRRNISWILIGGENMPYIMDRQGQKLNKFSRVNLSYFSRDAEWDDFSALVRLPTSGVLAWHDDAVSEIFNATNGNPYFAKILCSSVLRNAIRERDADVTAEEVIRAIQMEISTFDSHHFAHLWQDGIHKAVEEREPEVLRRTRVLVGVARCIRNGVVATVSNIGEAAFVRARVESDILGVLNDFVRREVLKEENGSYSFVLPIFGTWLVEVGVNRLAGDSLSEELANYSQALEDEARVRSEEIVELTQRWPTYRGRRIGSDDVRAWCEQVPSHRDQRSLFRLLQALRFFSEVEVREKLRAVHAFLRPSLPEFIMRKASDRRADILITYLDGEGKSGQQYAAHYAEENKISVESIKDPRDLAAELGERVRQRERISAIVIVDDIAATGRSMEGNLGQFLEECGDAIGESGARIFVVTIAATREAEKRLRKYMSNVEGVDIDFRTCELLTEETMAFSSGSNIWSDEEEKSRAKALCRDIGSKIYPKSPLGYGDMGLLVAFPSTVPNNALPILHSFSRATQGNRWAPLLLRAVN